MNKVPLGVPLNECLECNANRDGRIHRPSPAVAFVGRHNSGKTTLLKELALAFGTYYTPEDVNLYILDFGGWGMSVFSGLPHVGGVVLDGEDEKLRKLEQLLRQEIEERKRVFLKNAVGSLAAYRETVSARLPAIVLLIDNIVPLFGQYPDSEENNHVFFADGMKPEKGVWTVMPVNEGENHGFYCSPCGNPEKFHEFFDEMIELINGLE